MKCPHNKTRVNPGSGAFQDCINVQSRARVSANKLLCATRAEINLNLYNNPVNTQSWTDRFKGVKYVTYTDQNSEVGQAGG